MEKLSAETGAVLIKKARIIDPQSSAHNKVCDILVENGMISQIGENLSHESAKSLSAENLHVSPGWMDLRVNFRDPGHEEKEDLQSGIEAAISGGFTAVGLSPDTTPTIDSKADIEYIYARAESYPLDVYPYGAVSQGLKHQELSEMYDMYQAGAVAFSTGSKALNNYFLAKLAMQYSATWAPAHHVFALDKNLIGKGVVHEGYYSTLLGLKGIPSLAEEVALHALLNVAAYAEAGLHINAVSSAKTLDIIASYQKELPITTDVALANICFTDEVLQGYDANFKTLPPIRSKTDREALINGIKNGSIQAITSNHEPHAIEDKRCEFDLAAFGIAPMESFFGALITHTGKELSLEEIINCISINPRAILDLEPVKIEVGEEANFTFFNPTKKYTLHASEQKSKAANNPFTGKELSGKPLGILNQSTLILTDDSWED